MICPASPLERVIRAGLAVFVAAFAVVLWEQPWGFALAVASAVSLLISALLPNRRVQREAETEGPAQCARS